jgi:pimeloyl-ACP methyl ester carboxylesterase
MTNPVALTTTVWGDGSRRALLLHGLTSSGAIWWRVAGELATVGYTVVAPDLRAHGTSPAGDDLTIDSYRDDVLLLGGGWDLLIGHSLGGAIAAAVVAVDPKFADRVILEDPAVESVETARLLADSPPQTENPTVEAVAAEHSDWHPHDVQLKVQALRQCGAAAPTRTMEDAAPWDLWPEILAVQVPTLILAADPDQGSLVSVELGTAAVQSNDLIEFAMIDGAGHSMHRDSYDRFMSLVDGFAR